MINSPQHIHKKEKNTSRDTKTGNSSELNLDEMMDGHAKVSTADASPVQRMVKEEEETKQKKSIQKQTAGLENKDSEYSSQKSSGNSLPEDVQAKMENAFGTSFSDVSIHQNDNSATGMGALAYTQGNNIHFAPGQFAPESQSGQELIGHELTHVVQQREGRVQPSTQYKEVAINDNSNLENEADVLGYRASRGITNETNEQEKYSNSYNVQLKENQEDPPEKKAKVLSGLKKRKNKKKVYEEMINRWLSFSKLSAENTNEVISLINKFYKISRDKASKEQFFQRLMKIPKYDSDKDKEITSSSNVVHNVERYNYYIEEASKRTGISVNDIKSIIATESGGLKEATSGAAFGLMQITKGTWKGAQEKYSYLKDYDFKTYMNDPFVNIMFGARIFKDKELNIQYGMNKLTNLKGKEVPLDLVLVAYNTGEAVVVKAIKNAYNDKTCKDPLKDYILEKYMLPAIESYPIVYNYYVSGKGKTHNKGKNAKEIKEEAIKLKYKMEINKYASVAKKYKELFNNPDMLKSVKNNTDTKTSINYKTKHI